MEWQLAPMICCPRASQVVIRDAASRSLLDLREQPGVRIGVIISDNDTMVFAPVSKNMEFIPVTQVS